MRRPNDYLSTQLILPLDAHSRYRNETIHHYGDEPLVDATRLRELRHGLDVTTFLPEPDDPHDNA